MVQTLRRTASIGLLIAFLLAGSAVPQARTAQPVHARDAKSSQQDRRARIQPSVPDEYTEIPYVETNPKPELTAEEQTRGFLVFHRPITEPVHPNTNPLPHERLNALSAFATPGEFEPVTFSLYPTRDLQEVRVSISPLKEATATIPVRSVKIQLATYWNIGFPRYTSRETYRRLPELLEQVTVHNSPTGECQRWWLTIGVPEDTRPGIYEATVTITEQSLSSPVTFPLRLRVLGFKLKSDPAKHYSSYYYTRNSVAFQGKDESFIQKATGNEYRAMIDFGLDTVPTMSLLTDRTGKTIELRHAEELDRMLAAGLRGPVPITAGNVISRIYRDTTPDGKREKHWAITKLPPPEFYERITSMFQAFEAYRKQQGWPAFVCCPIDEVAASHKEFGWQVYRAVKKAGIRTYATKNPLAADADVYRPYIDVWCSQPYSATYEKISQQDRYDYWCYPNHNAGEIKDRRVMCKGGRMTYGFGFWRSGYTTLIPWHWSWSHRPDQFDYLRGTSSGSGQRIGDDGEVIPAIYWECFREGRDDARYLYTLQQAVWEREETNDPKCKKLVSAAQKLLQENWDAIDVQQKYLADGMWPDTEFNARRWQLASAILALLEFPAIRKGTAPSVLVPNRSLKEKAIQPSLVESAAAAGNVDARDIGERFDKWRNGTKEGNATVTNEANQTGQQPGLRWQLTVDHEQDGGEGGKYPVGWPRIARTFAKNELDLSQYDYIEYLVRVDSNRDEVADDSTPLGMTIASHLKSRSFFETRYDLEDRQRTWIPVRYAVKEMMRKTGLGDAPWKNISRVQLYIRESDYAHGTQLTFDIDHIRLLQFRTPMISLVELPQRVMLPAQQLPVHFEVIGEGSVTAGTHKLTATAVDSSGRTFDVTQDLASGRLLLLNLVDFVPGQCSLKIEIISADGENRSEWTGTFEGIRGPFYEN